MLRAIYSSVNMRATVVVLEGFADRSNFYSTEYNIAEFGVAKWGENLCKEEANRSLYGVSQFNTNEWGADEAAKFLEQAEWNIAEFGVSGWGRYTNKSEYNMAQWGIGEWSSGIICSFAVPNAGARLSAVLDYVDMRAIYHLSSPNFGGDGSSGSVFDSRAIDEWTLNG